MIGKINYRGLKPSVFRKRTSLFLLRFIRGLKSTVFAKCEINLQLKTDFLLVCVVFLAFTLRFVSIEYAPPSLNWDEVSHGYNAYSILKTGKDEWGETFPSLFRAFGDYKLPVYIYLTALSEALFGLNSFSVRLPSVLAGVAAVVFTFLLVRRLFNKEVALIAALLVSIEPWTFFLSRTALEANVSITFVIAGVYFFGASSGTHEVTNYLNTRFCDAGKVDTQICNIISYNDDEFSHIVYYLGFVLMNIVLMVTEYNIGQEKGMTKKAKGIVAANAIFIGLGIFANLAFEEIGLDLYFFGSMMALSLYLLAKKGWKYSYYPILFYFAVSYSLGVVGTVVYKFLA